MASRNLATNIDKPENVNRFLQIIRGEAVEPARPGSPGGPDASTFLTQLNRKDQTVTTDSTEAHPPRHYTPTQKSLLARKAEMAKSPQGYMESVVENFRRANLGQVVEGRGAKSVGVAIIGDSSESTLLDEKDLPDHEKAHGFANKLSLSTIDGFDASETLDGVRLSDGALKPREDDFNTDGLQTEAESLSSFASKARLVEEEDSPAFDEPRSSPETVGATHDTPVPSPRIVVTASSDSEPCSVDGDHKSEGAQSEDREDREHLAHFTSWGSPSPRSRSGAQVRTVLLSGLPATADLTMVQSLVHGGMIETMKIRVTNPAVDRSSANVTFTTADACHKYWEQYPNGLMIKHRGKKYSVQVDKQTQPDILSSMMLHYLDCGATRVVKVSEADDDWGIVALNKLATGKNNLRQVETINDTFRSGSRIIQFRFSNITDAVRFKGALSRDVEWEGCPVEFGKDPCEEATGIHGD